ncbi:hypothetical protein E4T39_04187 [Aureobasidium subglaciale]|nr:hypothetical protein E4T39_04187 [Aureobasidium subglaciale]
MAVGMHSDIISSNASFHMYVQTECPSVAIEAHQWTVRSLSIGPSFYACWAILLHDWLTALCSMPSNSLF